MPVNDIAKALGVSYVLDGRVRKSGARVRVVSWPIRADNGYLVWSETYDRPFYPNSAENPVLQGGDVERGERSLPQLGVCCC